jgi:hypothetical protein
MGKQKQIAKSSIAQNTNRMSDYLGTSRETYFLGTLRIYFINCGRSIVDSLDWYSAKEEGLGDLYEDDLPEPDEIAAEIMMRLQTAMEQMNYLTELLNNSSVEEEV